MKIGKSITARLRMLTSSIIIITTLLIASIAAYLYTDSLLETMLIKMTSLGHFLADEAAEKILTDDSTTLQKMIKRQISNDPSIEYILILDDNNVIAHTFPNRVPTNLLDIKFDFRHKSKSIHLHDDLQARQSSKNNNNFSKIKDTLSLQKTKFNPSMAEVTLKDGKKYFDISCPVLSDRAVVLRIGFSQKPYLAELKYFGWKIAVITVTILFFSILLLTLFVGKITHPLTTLAMESKDITIEGIDIPIKGNDTDEVGRLASSFNLMVEYTDEYTKKLEIKTNELISANNRIQQVCGVFQKIGELSALREIGEFLTSRLAEIWSCGQMALLVFNENHNILFIITGRGIQTLKSEKDIKKVEEGLNDISECFRSDNKLELSVPIITSHSGLSFKQTIIPLRMENQLMGALLIECPISCKCDDNKISTIGSILTQCAMAIKRGLEKEEEALDFKEKIEITAEFNGIIGKDPKMQVIYKLIDDIAPTDATVLILGESGTGKELVAKAIHDKSPRKNMPFVVINCSAYPATLLESELFGHEKGAYTGATRRKPGRFEQAHEGTVFLDEIGEISPQAQIKLLRVIQTRRFKRVGGEQIVEVDVRILAATNRDLLSEVKNGNFREDLYYRLNVIPINLPPLVKRPNDIPLLARYFLKKFAAEQKKDIEDFSSETMRVILDYNWPGNVRELENSIEHSVILAKGKKITLTDLPSNFNDIKRPEEIKDSKRSLPQNEMMLLKEVLFESGWNKKKTAERLGISRSTLYSKIRKYNLNDPNE